MTLKNLIEELLAEWIVHASLRRLTIDRISIIPGILRFAAGS